ncbi:MAG: DoxX family protein [Candidatus Azambacteria bacterium]|nr:DoxX family protein [Candidatus Azambacteria bacterium]
MKNFSPFGGSPAGGKKISLFLLRISLGVLFFWAGYTKLIDPQWSAAGYIAGSKSFIGFYNWLLQPEILPVINFLNEWGLTLIGIALILGIFVRLASFFGIIIMILYYLPIFPSAHGLVDEHIIYSAVFLVLMAFGAGEILTASTWIQTRLHPMWHKWVD